MRRILLRTAIAVLSLLVLVLAVSLASCAKTEPAVAIAYAALPKTWDLSTIVDWRKAEPVPLDVPADSTLHVAAFAPDTGSDADWVALAGRKVWRVEFKVEEPSILGPFVVYVDRATGAALGYEPRN